MTSKEIVELLCELVDLKELTNRGLILKDINNFQRQLEKDLEVLEQYKKTEEELGIELLTLFKALNNGAWTKFNNEISKCDECEYEMLDIYIYFYWNSGKHLVFLLSDYGKTWALTKEELENEK